MDLQTEIDRLLAARDPETKLVVELAKLSKGAPITLSSPLEIKGDKVELRGGVLLGGSLLKAKPRILDTKLVARLAPEAKGKVSELELPPSFKVSDFVERGFGLAERLSHTELLPWKGASTAELLKVRPLTPAQWPNAAGPEGSWQLTGEIKGSGSFIDPSGRPERWASTQGVWTHGYWQFDWAEHRVPVKAYDKATKQVDLVESGQGPLKSYGLFKGRRFIYLNVLEELDQPGEYWLDVMGNRILAWLPDGVKQVLASQVGGPLIKVQGQEEVILSGLSLVGGRGPALEFKDCRSCQIKDTKVISPGGAGLLVLDGEGVAASRLTIQDAGEEGVRFTGGDRKTLTSARHALEDSTIQRVSRWVKTYRPGVLMDGVGSRVSRCLITDLPHTAILFKGNDFVIEQNDIRRVCQETSDAGAIYTGRNPTMRGTVIRFNRFREMSLTTKTEGTYHAVICIYLDDCHPGIEVIGNIIESKCIGLMIGGGRDNKIVGNIFIGAEPAVSFDARAKSWAKEHFKEGWNYGEDLKTLPVTGEIWRRKYPALAAAIESKADFAWPEGCTFVDNVVFGPSVIRYLDGLKQSDWMAFDGNVMRDKPGTLDEALQLRPARSVKIPWKEIGPKPLPVTRG